MQFFIIMTNYETKFKLFILIYYYVYNNYIIIQKLKSITLKFSIEIHLRCNT